MVILRTVYWKWFFYMALRWKLLVGSFIIKSVQAYYVERWKSMLFLHCAQGLAEEEFSGSPDSDSFFLFSVFLPEASTAAENIKTSVSGQVGFTSLCQAAMLEFWDSCTEINIYLSVHFNGLSLSKDFHYTSAPNNGLYQWWSSKDLRSLQWGLLGKDLSSSAQTVSCRSETELRYL